MRVFISILIFLSVSVLEGTVFHTVIVADTYARMVGADISMTVESDFRAVRLETQKMALSTGIPLIENLCIGKEASSRQVLQTIRKLNVEPDDVVLFYFAGHGYRTEEDAGDPWPTLNFGVDEKALHFSNVIELLIEKGAKLTIALADSCNNTIPEEFALPEILIARVGFPESIRERYREEGLQALMLRTEGIVLACAAKADTYSRAGLKRGGIFTNAFFESLYAECASAYEPSWGTILERTAEMIADLQEPYYYVDETREIFQVH